jgi:hypothetical protein
MNHLETLVRQFYAWQGYIVRGNVKVGPLPHGGWKGELDVVAYHPQKGDLIHLETSLDALSWSKREVRLRRKFKLGRRHICQDVFPWLKPGRPIQQVAVLVSAARKKLGRAQVISVDQYVARIKDAIKRHGPMRRSAIPEEFDLLRTLQLALCGYAKVED